MINKLIKEVEDKHLRPDPLKFEVGDTVDVHCRIVLWLVLNRLPSSKL